MCPPLRSTRGANDSSPNAGRAVLPPGSLSSDARSDDDPPVAAVRTSESQGPRCDIGRPDAPRRSRELEVPRPSPRGFVPLLNFPKDVACSGTRKDGPGVSGGRGREHASERTGARCLLSRTRHYARSGTSSPRHVLFMERTRTTDVSIGGCPTTGRPTVLRVPLKPEMLGHPARARARRWKAGSGVLGKLDGCRTPNGPSSTSESARPVWRSGFHRPDLYRLNELVDLGIHEPSTMPFTNPWTDTPLPRRHYESLRFWWSARANWSPENWHFTGAVFVDGAPVGVQALIATNFARLRTVESGSWLGRQHQGQGLGKEMRAAILHLAFEGSGPPRPRAERFTTTERRWQRRSRSGTP